MRFKNTKKEARKSKYPSNSRIIPASGDRPDPAKFLKIYRASLKVFLAFIFILAMIIVFVDLQKNLSIKENIDMGRGSLTKELNFWEDFISKHKDYRDAYFQASILEYKLGNVNNAKKYVGKGLSLDPNSEDGKKLKQLLINR